MTLEFWHWLAFGFILMAVELILPSFFFLWLGISAVAVGLLLMAMPDLAFTVQGALFAVAGVISFYASRTFFKGKQSGFGPATLNKRGSKLVGEIVTLETAIENGHGKAHVGDGVWSVEGPDLPTGARVKVIAVDGTTLKVERIN